jgi:hypothetical protein
MFILRGDMLPNRPQLARLPNAIRSLFHRGGISGSEPTAGGIPPGSPPLIYCLKRSGPQGRQADLCHSLLPHSVLSLRAVAMAKAGPRYSSSPGVK